MAEPWLPSMTPLLTTVTALTRQTVLLMPWPPTMVPLLTIRLS